MKMRVIQVRGSWKDYVDPQTLATHGVDLPTALAAARAIDSRFHPALSLRALQFYGDGSLAQVPKAVQRDLTRWAQQVQIAHLPSLPAQRGFGAAGEPK